MTHVLHKLPHPKSSSSSSSSSRHQYQQVPLDAKSDSEDDETLLYAAPSLNEQTNSKTINSFGVGVYDHSCDLDLPRIRRLSEKGRESKTGRARNFVNSKAFACIFVVLACLLIAVIAAFAVLVAGNWEYFSSSNSSSTPSPSCFPVPKPLSDGKQVPCQTTEPPVSTQPLPPLSSSSPLSEALPTSKETTLSVTEAKTPAHTSEIVTDMTSAKYFDPETTVEAEATTEPSKEEPTFVDRPTGGGTENAVTTDHVTVGSQGTPKEDTMVKFNVTVGRPETTPEASCFPVPMPLPDGRIQLCHTPSLSSSSSFSLTPSSIDSARSAIPSPAPTPVSLNIEAIRVTTPNTDGIVKTDSVREETTLPTSFDQPTSAPTKITENDNENENSVATATENEKQNSNTGPLSWERKFMPAVTESTPEVFDLDGDGIGERMLVEDFSMCAVHVSALNGIDGSTVWQQMVNFPVFAVRCILDINSDGTLDCIVTGRGGGFLTLDGLDGHILWVVEQSLVFPRYNFYFPLRLPDINGDGVDDLINVHGGDVSYEPEVHNRSPAFLVAVSGKTGQTLMDRILMPDGHESYMSPVLFSVNGTDKMILFGSGGETVPGSLWGVELISLQARIASYWAQHLDVKYQINLNDTFHPCFLKSEENLPSRPVMDRTKFDFNRLRTAEERECPTWGGKQTAIWNDYGVCLYEFVRSVSKGVILPPVVVDLTGDEVDDLVVSTFDGHTIALDGQNLNYTLWDAYHPGTESYSIPAPLFYTSDDIPDLLIRTNLGEWSEGYDVSSIRVLDGRNGSTLWTFNSTTSGMMSAITLVSRTHGRDALIFYAIGQARSDDGHNSGDDGSLQNTHRNKKRRRRHTNVGAEVGEAEDYGNGETNQVDYNDDAIVESLNHEDPPNLWVSTPDDPLPDTITLDSLLGYCGMTRSGKTVYLYMFNREMIESGMIVLPLATYEPQLYFQPTSNPNNHSTQQRHVIEKRHIGDYSNPKDQRKFARCGHISSPTDIVGTPLLRDLNSDGRLDIVYDVVWSPAIAAPPQMLAVATDLEVLFEGAYGKGILDFKSFLPPEDQPWTQYMGKGGDCVFRHPQST